MAQYRLKLYVTGQTPRALRAITNARRFCDEVLAGNGELVIVDVHTQPQLAEAENIVATPTLVKESPTPTQRIVGDLFDGKLLMDTLDLQ